MIRKVQKTRLCLTPKQREKGGGAKIDLEKSCLKEGMELYALKLFHAHCNVKIIFHEAL